MYDPGIGIASPEALVEDVIDVASTELADCARRMWAWENALISVRSPALSSYDQVNGPRFN